MSFRKVWWESTAGKTAGLVFDDAKLKRILARPNGLAELSRAWPMTEAMKMTRLYMSPECKTWDEAFASPRGEE
jgi:hypothetical protein